MGLNDREKAILQYALSSLLGNFDAEGQEKLGSGLAVVEAEVEELAEKLDCPIS